jgi:4-hydroxymandelate oxidase
VRDFVAGGAGDEVTLGANRAALDRVFVVPRAPRDVSGCSTASTLLGRRAAAPLAVAPVAYHRLLHPDGEVATARAARRAGVPFVVGTLSSVAVEEVTATGAATWFQLYWLRDAERALGLVRRAEDAGCEAIVLTVDVPWMGRRLRDARNRFALPPEVTAAHLDDGARGAAHRGVAGTSAVATHTARAFSPAVSWGTVDRLRAATRLPLVLKGVLDPRDAVRAAEAGADAVVVSNHGGRQLDGAVPSVLALPGVVAAVAATGLPCQVLFDSGVRGGTDVLRALALGADGVLAGRPVLWGLAAGGAAGAYRVLELLAAETRDALALAGCASVAEARSLETVRL